MEKNKTKHCYEQLYNSQVCLYSIVCRRLFLSTENLHRKKTVQDDSGTKKEKDSDAIRARKGVVKMLIASVAVYTFSYAPIQIPLIFMIADATFKNNWSVLVLFLTLGYVNSAANPALYSIFSQNFRRKFHSLLCCLCTKGQEQGYTRTTSNVLDNKKNIVRFSNSRMTTTITSVSEI